MAKSMAKSSKRKPKKLSSPLLFAGIIVGLMIIIAVVAYFNRPAPAQELDVVATVNGDTITRAEFAFQYNLLPDAYKQQLTQREVLEQIIDEELVMQEAVARGAKITDEDVNARIQEILSAGSLSVNDLQENLASYNITMDDFEALIRRQLVIQELTKTIEIPEPTDDDLKLLYDATKEKYAVPDQVTVRHVLISTQRTDAAQVAKDVYDKARNGTDFCKLAANQSDDRGSRDACGKYTFPRGVMVKEFEEASFTMRPGEYRMVQTTFGYHVINKIADLPARVKPLSEVKDDVTAAYENLEYSRRYASLVTGLRAKATITYADGKTQTPAVPSVEQEAATPQEQLAAAPSEVMSCIARTATLYGASWNADTLDAQKMFEGSGLKVILCDERPEACSGITAYPMWKISGKTYLGRMTIEQLAEASSC